jgi:hypothetical protein
MNQEATAHLVTKAKRREKKRTEKRDISGEDVIFLFEKVLEGWKTIQIYNALLRAHPGEHISKTMVEKYASGNCKVYESELEKERYETYLLLREKVYQYRKEKILYE